MTPRRAPKFARRLWAFWQAPWSRKRLGLEAVFALIRARIATMRRAKHYTKLLGTLGATEGNATPENFAEAREIGHIVEITALGMPFRAVCLQQAIAVRMLLQRRGIPATVYLGMARRDVPTDGQNYDAHAWVTTDGQVINGNIDLENYTIVGKFA